MGPPETEKLLKGKGDSQQDKTTAHRLGKDLHQPHIWQRADLQNIQITQEASLQNTKKSH